MYLGYRTTGTGSYNLSGTGSLSSYWQYIGYSGTGTFSQSGGTNSATYLQLGVNAGATGTYNLGGGQLLASNESVGNSGTGAFTQTGGTNTVSSSLAVGGSSTARELTISARVDCPFRTRPSAPWEALCSRAEPTLSATPWR